MLFRSKNQEIDMLSGSIFKGLFRIAIPVMIMNVTMSLFNIVDMTVLRIFDTGGGFAVGAVGACGMLITTITGLLIGCATGANVTIAKYIGMHKPEKVERATGAAVLFSLLGGILLGVIGVVFAETFLRWTNCPEQLLPDATLYFRMYFAGLPILMLYNFFAAILRSVGDSKRPMVYLVLGSAVKLLFNLIFVGGMSMTVEGVGFATLLSWVLMFALGLRALLTHQGMIRLKFSRLRLYWAELKEILIIGIPAGLQQALFSVANVIITAAVNSFGAEATTGISIANQFDGLLYQITNATSIAVMPYVSQNIGRGNIDRARRAVWDGTIITILLGASFGALSAIFAPQLSSMMSGNPTVIAYSCQKMVIISSTYFICGINNILSEAMRGMGKPALPTLLTLIYMCLLRFVWVYLLFPLVPNFTFLYLVWPVGWILSIITVLPVFFKTLKKLRLHTAA